MVVEQNQYKVVVDNKVKCVVVHNLQSLVVQELGKLEIDQNQVAPMEQVQTGVGITGIGVVEIEAAAVVKSTAAVVGTIVVHLIVVIAQQ